jgi:hypothetical protein
LQFAHFITVCCFQSFFDAFGMLGDVSHGNQIRAKSPLY